MTDATIKRIDTIKNMVLSVYLLKCLMELCSVRMKDFTPARTSNEFKRKVLYIAKTELDKMKKVTKNSEISVLGIRFGNIKASFVRNFPSSDGGPAWRMMSQLYVQMVTTYCKEKYPELFGVGNRYHLFCPSVDVNAIEFNIPDTIYGPEDLGAASSIPSIERVGCLAKIIYAAPDILDMASRTRTYIKSLMNISNGGIITIPPDVCFTLDELRHLSGRQAANLAGTDNPMARTIRSAQMLLDSIKISEKVPMDMVYKPESAAFYQSYFSAGNLLTSLHTAACNRFVSFLQVLCTKNDISFVRIRGIGETLQEEEGERLIEQMIEATRISERRRPAEVNWRGVDITLRVEPPVTTTE